MEESSSRVTVTYFILVNIFFIRKVCSLRKS